MMKRMIALAVLLVCGAVWMAMMALDVVRLTDGHMNKGIRSITYNVLNLPSSISFSDGQLIHTRHTIKRQ